MRKRLKMYILVREEVPLGKAIVGVAHASLACYLKYQNASETQQWLKGPFYKTVCKVSDAEFEKAKQETDWVVMTESTLNHAETVIAFKPRADYPSYFHYFRLFK
ncbi:peptidyl-tRNA hydrolase [Rapidithrix thailandica]|uniref:peptidyl-tRNA hydrolase n=1 Tax=Rapidithrix thailandica TaxID=413964 RepID=A0AAW9SLH5_9BACT